METLGKIRSRRYILASASPRRKELLAGLDIDFTVELSGQCDETYPQDLPLEQVPEYISNMKSDAFTRKLEEGEVLITADTMVLCGNEILGKPSGREDAVSMLEKLSGKRHKVLTGVTIRTPDKRKSFTASTEVTFAELEKQEIEYYVDHYRPFDKAGAYAVQEWIGHIGISGISGSYYNVVGLPVQRLYEELKQL